MNTGINITDDSLYFQQYCTNYSDGTCQEWITVLGIGKEELKQGGVEILTTCAVFILVVMLLVWLVKGIFRLILPTKGRR